MVTWISQDTEQVVPLLCRFCATGRGKKFYDKPTRIAAVRLRGQWEGGDFDVDPHWVPVCWEHDNAWDVDPDIWVRLDRKYQLPTFDLENWWVVIDRDGSAEMGKPMTIGPFPDEASAALARDESLLVQGELEDPGGTDCFIQPWKGLVNQEVFDVVLITLDEPTYTGRPE